MNAKVLRAATWIGKALAWTVVAIGTTWAGLALWIDGPSSRHLAGTLSGGFVLGAAALVAFRKPRLRSLGIVAVGVAVVAGWWFTIAPSNDRAWGPEVARVARTTRVGDRVTIENVRDFEYRSDTDFTVRWETRTYDLSRLRGMDMFLSYWGSDLITHTIASFEFDDGRHLAVSIETRKEKGEELSSLRGFFRQYELIYVVGEERDLVGVRARHRGERLYLYRMRIPPEKARAILEQYLKSIDALAAKAAWYNALTQNCTTTIRMNAREAVGAGPFDWRILVNGRLDELGYERGRIDTSLPFDELRKRSEVTEKAKETGAADDFSARIRAGIPGARK